MSRETMTPLPPTAILIAPCTSAAQLDREYQNAYQTRKKFPRSDGHTYKIQRSVKSMTVTVSVVPNTLEQ